MASAPTRTSIDLNADLGEGYGPWSLTNDAGLMSVITSANMSCGAHAGEHWLREGPRRHVQPVG